MYESAHTIRFSSDIALLFSELCHTQYWLRWAVFVKKNIHSWLYKRGVFI